LYETAEEWRFRNWGKSLPLGGGGRNMKRGTKFDEKGRKRK
jgi:hypothetical protein